MACSRVSFTLLYFTVTEGILILCYAVATEPSTLSGQLLTLYHLPHSCGKYLLPTIKETHIYINLHLYIHTHICIYTIGSRIATVRFTTIHFYDPCPVGPSTPDLWCILSQLKRPFSTYYASSYFPVCMCFLFFYFSAVLLS